MYKNSFMKVKKNLDNLWNLFYLKTLHRKLKVCFVNFKDISYSKINKNSQKQKNETNSLRQQHIGVKVYRDTMNRNLIKNLN